MVVKDEITVAVDELQKGVCVLIDSHSYVTIDTEECRTFYDKVHGFVVCAYAMVAIVVTVNWTGLI